MTDDREKKDVADEGAGVEIGMGEPNTFEPEEDPDAAPDPTESTGPTAGT